jgi:Domain of Unknown Function (DUF1080)
MTFEKIACVAVFAILILSATGISAGTKADASATPRPEDTVQAYLGRWDLTLNAPDHEYPSWVELRMYGGQLKAEFVGRWGNARPLPRAEFSNGRVTFVSPKDEEASPSDFVFTGSLTGGTLSGTLTGPSGPAWTWTGVRAPELKRKGTPKWGKPIALFDGKDLTGWRMQGGGSTVWKVEDGNLITPGNGPELINDQKFEDFKLHAEFNCGPMSNSGVYLRGRYEVQVETDSIEEPPSHHMGGIYGFIAPTPELPRTPDAWQTYDITLLGRWVTVVQNGTTIIDDKEIPGITGGALDSHEELPGPIYLQGSEKGHVKYRSVVITPTKM